MSNLYINAIGHYLPKEIINNDYFLSMNGLSDEWISKRTGIKTRVRCSEDENGNTMAVDAVRVMLKNNASALEGVDLIVGATYSPYDTVMSIAHAVQRAFKIEDARSVTVTSACSSFVNALEIAETYIASGKCKKALVVVSEHNSAYSNDICSKSGHLWGDGAACTVVSAEKNNEKDPEVIDIYTEGLGHIGLADESVYLRPANGKLEMPNGRDVFIHACNYMTKAIQLVAERNNLPIENIDCLIPHQANVRIMKNVATGLKISEDKVIENITTLGNTGSASTLIALSQNYDKMKADDNVMFTVFGGGYSTGSIYLKF
ncbi:MAG: ketoacyl-ACP synthase III [Bacteroidales bacterium]|jgi:3-oxoacyl-[acyl-carrier-protein] synthase-3|nr:ketoacyl-ACP synthase III [Bacteroidales bacterium]